MDSTKLPRLIIILLFLLSIFTVNIASAEDTIDNFVTAEFNIEFVYNWWNRI